MDNRQTISTLLCAIDFDVNSLAALDMASYLSKATGAKLHLLHVLVPPHTVLRSAPFLTIRAGDYARMRLNEIARQSLSGVEHAVMLKTGDAAQQILRTAGEIRAGLVVIAANARGAAVRRSLGRVAEKVVRECIAPVMTVRALSTHNRETENSLAR